MATAKSNTTRWVCMGVLLMLIAVAGSGCATTASQKYVAFPSEEKTPEQQFIDRGQCEEIATMHKGSDADAAIAMGALGGAVGAAGGAAYGAIIGALAHGVSAGSGSLIGLGVGAAVGLTIGIVQGLQANQLRYERIYIACLRARRYEIAG